MFLGGTYKPSNRQRIFSRPRRKPGRGWIVAAVFAAFVGLAWLWAFQRGPDSAPAVVPVLRADNTPMRKKPDDPGGLKVLDIDPLADDSGRAAPRVERLLPPPETPLPRPSTEALAATTIPPNAAAAAVPPNAAAAAPIMMPIADRTVGPPVQLVPQNSKDGNSSAGGNATPAATTKPVPSAPPPSTGSAAKPSPAPTPAAAETVAKPAPSAASSGDKGYRIQLASVRSEASAKATWDQLRHEHGEILGSLPFAAVSVDLGDRGTFYRVMAGPLSQDAAIKACDELKRRGAACILVRP